jgi:hypothetical protein
MGSVAAGSNGGPTPIPFGITSARRLDAVRPGARIRKMTAADAIACRDIKRKHSGGSHATRCPLLETDRPRRRPLKHGVCRPSAQLRERNKLSGLAFRMQRHWEIRTCSSWTAFCCTTAFTVGIH